MTEHFCTCPASSCRHHPSSHDQGCDPCIQKNLRLGEIPSCFWLLVDGDISGEEKYTIDCFTDFFQRNRERYEARMNG